MAKSGTTKPNKMLPQWKVYLLNDDDVQFKHVVKALMTISSMTEENATNIATEANNNGKSIIMTTHLEKAELIKDRFETCEPSISTELEAA